MFTCKTSSLDGFSHIKYIVLTNVSITLIVHKKCFVVLYKVILSVHKESIHKILNDLSTRSVILMIKDLQIVVQVDIVSMGP